MLLWHDADMPTLPQLLLRVPQAVAHPRGLGRSIRDQILHFGSSPLDRRIPWISYSAIDLLEDYLTPGMTVYEFGSGGSTLWLAERVKRVVSIEERDNWATVVSDILRQDGFRNRVEIRRRTADRSSPEAFISSPYAQALPEEPADAILIDGCERRPQDDLRPAAFRLAEDRIRPGGLIILDDAKRYLHLREHHRAKKVHPCWGFGPCRYDQAETDVFVY